MLSLLPIRHGNSHPIQDLQLTIPSRRLTVVSDGRDDSTRWLTGLLSFVSAVLLSTFILLVLPSSSVSLSNFYLAVPMRGCLGKHSCMSSPFPITILNGTCSLRALILFCGDEPAIKTKLNKQTFATDGALQQHTDHVCRLLNAAEIGSL